MHSLAKSMTALIGMAVLSLICTSTARASCVDPTALASKRPVLTPLDSSVAARLVGAGMLERSDDGEDSDSRSIVGLWHFVFHSVGNDHTPFDIPDGAPLDMGYAQWHSDKTEIMNSFRDPATSNFCLGVYEAIGKQAYKLNHFALSWDNTGHFCTPTAPATSCFVGPTNIREQDTLGAHGDSYTGTVTIEQFHPDGTHFFTLTGTVEAQRITAD